MSNKKLEIFLYFLVNLKSDKPTSIIRLSALARRKEAERNRNVIASDYEEHIRELEQQRLIEQQIRLQNVLNDGELRRRLALAHVDIWYVPVLAKGDVTKYSEIRKQLVIDALTGLEVLIQAA
jgi:hypothetical protein